MEITPTGPAGVVGAQGAVSPAPKVTGSSFSEVLADALGEISSLQDAADKAAEGLVTGEVRDVHQVVLAFERAQIAFQLAMEVRNKLVESYQEVMRMQL
jgi:flagellar hook-basal body complex protein FliE